MTKAEVRAACLSKLALRPADLCYDVGCGTGSVTVEMALSAYRGRVYAIDQNEAALALTKENCAAFQIGNVETVCGPAPEAFSALPAPDAAFVGGSSGNLGGIVTALKDKNSQVRIVITAVALESALAAIRAMQEAGIEPELVQLSVARAKAVGDLHLMNAQNPIFIVSGGGT
jgi:precorrin-6Y C5,15-methyltransferase (decarboxylating)